MARFVFAMNASLDGYVDHESFAPDPVLFRHWIDQIRSLTGTICGSRIYGLMRYWDEDRPEWTADERDFAVAWRDHPKWVVSRSLEAVGQNATLISQDVEDEIRGLKQRLEGEVDVSGPDLVRSLAGWGLVDEYRLYYHPVVLGAGKPFFDGHRPRLRLVGSERIGAAVVRLSYVPA